MPKQGRETTRGVVGLTDGRGDEVGAGCAYSVRMIGRTEDKGVSLSDVYLF